MILAKWYDAKKDKLQWYDISLLKISMVAFGLLLAKLYAPILTLDTIWYAVVFLVPSIYLMVKTLR